MGISTAVNSGYQSTSTTYVSPTGTVGTANTAMTVITRTLRANFARQLKDRIKIRCYFFANSVAPITFTVKLGPAAAEVPIGRVIHVGHPLSGLLEIWLHYIDSTHANIIEQHIGALGALSAVNVNGFSWNAEQNLIVTQNAVSGNFITVYGIFVDYLPLGVI